MSTIKIEFWSEDKNEIAQLLNALAGVNGNAKSIENIEVMQAEEVKAETPVKTPTPRASRAKARVGAAPDPTPEPEGEIEEDDDLDEDESTAEDSIDADDIRAVQATKVDKHREVIKAQLKKLGATGIKDLDEAHYAKYYDFLSNLK